MKKLKIGFVLATLAIGFTNYSCGTTNDSGGSSDSSATTMKTDSGNAESTKAMGVGEDNQDEVPGYPANQSNLNADSTREKH
ncbi:hypothetical protein [Dyadobacter sp. Leaf189]|uniref:hypothetical protein n=1 Tax=Dyadobacter sp. Leaf189 TaxID=1736295 RepID=UPI0006FC9BCF|nr:hypothetical protein [Dyadobacter sp. Leaf189]KQS34031.1 hypothetical protein ASG33_08385 [Dyadobacter sp. Leaf189]